MDTKDIDNNTTTVTQQTPAKETVTTETKDVATNQDQIPSENILDKGDVELAGANNQAPVVTDDTSSL
ncbi:MAG: hypothetical protein RCG15_03720 [Candidatus Rickettsia vulgarisii]